MTRESKFLVFLSFFLIFPQVAFAHSPNPDRLAPSDVQLAKSALKTLKISVDPKKSEGLMNLLTFEELFALLSSKEKTFLEGIRKLNPKELGATAHTFDKTGEEAAFTRVEGQSILRNGVSIPLPRQYLPADVYAAYQAMMSKMKKEIGKTLLVDSGYRSPAYQLYLFLRYLPKHGYSIRETNRFVALPGHSEHGAPERQAIDFINEEGMNGEDDPAAFEALVEYRWLRRHAHRYGFFLSYPRGNRWGTSFEPWHWHFEGKNQ